MGTEESVKRPSQLEVGLKDLELGRYYRKRLPATELTGTLLDLWKTGYDLRLMPAVNDVNDIPAEGKKLTILAAFQGLLHFRIFDAEGRRAVDANENALPGKALQIRKLKKLLSSCGVKMQPRSSYGVKRLLRNLFGLPTRFGNLRDVAQISIREQNMIVAAVHSIAGHRPEGESWPSLDDPEWMSARDFLQEHLRDILGGSSASFGKKPHGQARTSNDPRIAEAFLVNMTNNFVDDIRCIDRKMKGGVLEAISKIVRAPMTAVGDTQKPLDGDKKGLWRFRVGNYRLIFKPELSRRIVTLLTFGARDEIYDP